MRARRAPRGGFYLTRSRPPETPESTSAERFYYQKQIESMTPLRLRLRGGGELGGILLWHDRGALGLRRPDGTEVVLDKAEVKYLWKDESARRPSRRGARPRS